MAQQINISIWAVPPVSLTVIGLKISNVYYDYAELMEDFYEIPKAVACGCGLTSFMFMRLLNEGAQYLIWLTMICATL